MTNLCSSTCMGLATLHLLATLALADIHPVAPSAPPAHAESPPPAKTIAADQARQHVGQLVTVTCKVQHAKFATAPDRVYLDSEKDYRDPKNMGVLIEAEALPVFSKAGIAKPAAHYDGKTIRITGKPFLRDNSVFIKADRPDQIKIIEPPK